MVYFNVKYPIATRNFEYFYYLYCMWRTGHKYRLKDINWYWRFKCGAAYVKATWIIIDVFSKRVALLFARWRFTVVWL